MTFQFSCLFPFILLCSFIFQVPLIQAQDYKQYISLNYEEIDSLELIENNNGNNKKCLMLAQAGKEKALNAFGKLDTLHAHYSYLTGFYYQKLKEYDKSLPFLLEANAIYEKVYGKEHAKFITSLYSIGYCYDLMNDYDQAISFFQEAINLQEKIGSKGFPLLVSYLNNLASLYHHLADYNKATLLYSKAKEICDKDSTIESDHILNDFASLQHDVGNYEEAMVLYLQSKDLREKKYGKEHKRYAISLNNIASLHQEIGNYDQALASLTQAKNIIKTISGIKSTYYAQSLNNMASLYKKMGNYDLALPLYIQAKDICKETLGEDHTDFALALNNLGSQYRVMGQYGHAMILFKQSIKIDEALLGRAHPYVANSINNLATTYLEQANFGKALPLLNEALNIQETIYGKEHIRLAFPLYNLSSAYEAMGDFEKALDFSFQEVAIKEKAYGKAHPSFVAILNRIGTIYLKMAKYNKAWEYFSHSIQTLTKVHTNKAINKIWADSLLNASYPSNLHLQHTIAALKYFYTLLQKEPEITNFKDKQLIVSDLAIALLAKAQNSVASDQDKLRLLASSSNWVQKSLAVLDPKDINKAFNLVDQNKSVLLLQATKSEAAYRLGALPEVLVHKDKKMLKKRSQLKAKLLEERLSQEKDSLRNELNHVNQNLDNFLNLIKEKYPKYYQLKHPKIKSNATEIQALLPKQTALLEYMIADSVVHIFYLDQKNSQWAKCAVSQTKLQHHVKSLHNALSDYRLFNKDKKLAYGNYIEKAHWFYQNLVAPVLKGRQNIKNLIIITDGTLGHLPFEAFLVEAATQKVSDYRTLHYLLNDYNISYNYSATLWKENLESPPPSNNQQILGMAANYKTTLDTSLKEVRLPMDQFTREQLAPLPAARKEVETLEKEFQGFFAFDSLASEKTIKERAQNYAIIHLAMHGILDNKRPVLSSLAFTEDNDPIESNFLQAHEISKMQLNANLVVLSACETGFGKFEKGNGIASLARSFMYAGASSLIVSLWQVNDFATSKIMQNLYHNLAENMKIDEALRQAKLHYITSTRGVFAHPAFWSPFIHIGNTAPLSIARKTTVEFWKIGLGILALIGIGVFVLKRKQHA